MASADFQEMQGMLGKITGMPQEGPEKPSWFSSASSPEWQQYNNYYEMQKMIQRASLLQELDQRLNPISLGESARFLGRQPEEIAAPNQIRDVTEDMYTPTVVEGPRPMGTRPGFGPKIGERQGAPGDYVTNPDELFPNGLSETPNLMSGMYQDFLDKKPPYYEPGQLISEHATIQEPVVLQGPGAPVEGPPRMEKVVTGREADVSAPASKLQRDMVQAELHRRSLQTPQPRARSEAEVKAEMANRYKQDPNAYYGEGVASGAIGADQNVKRTDSGVNLSGAKAENLQAQTEYTRRTLEPRIAQMQANTAKARQEVTEMKNLTDPKRQKMLGEITKNEAYVDYLKSRSDGRDAELALRESKLYAMLSEAERKHALAQLAAAKELHKSGDFTDEMFDDILGGIFKNLNVEGVHSAPSLGQRLGSMLGGEPLPEEEPVVGGPNLKAGPQTGETSSLRMKQHEQRGKSAGPVKTPIVPNIEQGPGTPPPPRPLGALGTEIVGYTDEGRPIVKNPDGTVSTERTMTEQIDGKWVNIPTMYGGKEVTPDEAVRIYRHSGGKDPETGRVLPTFDSMQEAVSSAKARSRNELGKYGGGGSPSKANVDDVAGAMAKEMGDLNKYEGKTIKDGKTGRRFKVTKGKLVEVK